MKSAAHKILMVVTFLSAAFANASTAFKEPGNDAEWKTFCHSPNYLRRVKAIQDKEQQQRVAGICARAPWQKFKPSEKKTY